MSDTFVELASFRGIGCGGVTVVIYKRDGKYFIKADEYNVRQAEKELPDQDLDALRKFLAGP